MLTEDEINFMRYWESNRLQKKKVRNQLSVGLPLSVALIIVIFVNLFSGWYQRANLEMRREDSSLILVLIVAALFIVAFIVIFSVRHRWDMNEQRYKELLSRKNES